ncbi:MAG: zf-HC2 domain-containing protein [Gemmatimonadales bacterium]
MSHLDEGTLHALLDGEIPSAELAPIQAHLEGCAECRARLDTERAWMTEADRLVQVIEPPVRAERGAPRPALGSRDSALGARRSAIRRLVGPLAWAATVVAAAGLGYAIRGLPSGQRVSLADTAAPPAERLEAAADRAAIESASAPLPRAESRAPSPEPPTPSRQAAEPSGRRADVPPAQQAADRAAEGRAPNLESPAEPTKPAAEPRVMGRLDQARRAEENVVTGVAQPPATPAFSAVKLELGGAAQPVNFPDALRRLDGTLKLIPGLIPARLEVRGDTVRVVYPTSYGDLVLAQQLRDGRIVHLLVAPPAFPADSLEKLRARIRD